MPQNELPHQAPPGKADGAQRELPLLTATAIAAVAIAFAIAFYFVRPAPPGGFTLATGLDSGAYHLYGKRYQELLAKDKISVALRNTGGSVENIKLLADSNSGVDVAFVQGGVGNAADHPGLVSLAALYYEPLWIFYRSAQELTLLSQLAQKKIAIGAEGSGTRALALNLLAASAADRDPTRFSALGGTAAARALIDGSIDAAMFVASPDAPVIKQLLHARGVRLMSLAHAEALARRFPYLATVGLPRGVIDLAGDIPPAHVTLVATTAYLVAREDFHPALVSVVLQAATRAHAGSGMFHSPGQFPVAREGDFMVSEDAARFFKSGPPFLQRYMPFWMANLAERMVVLLVPLLAFAIPMMRIFPGLYNWRVRSRVFRWYGELKAVELEASKHPAPARVAELLRQLDAIQDGVNHTKVPLSYSDYAYNLKWHIDFVRNQLQGRAQGDAAAGDRSSSA